MTRGTPADLEVAFRFLAYERGTTGSSAERAAAALRVYERLADRLGPLIGSAGMQALFVRSLRLTTMEVPCFGEVIDVEPPAPATASRERLLSCLSALEPTATSEAAAALFGTLFGLLTAFIGERLVWQVLRGAFPGIDESGPKETES